MENVVLVPQRLQDISPQENKELHYVVQNNNNNDDAAGLYDVFNVLKDFRNVLETGELQNACIHMHCTCIARVFHAEGGGGGGYENVNKKIDYV